MATTRIISLHGRKGHSIVQTLRDRINYVENPEKTNGGRLVSSYECSPETAADEFAAGKYIYKVSTGKEQTPEKDVLDYMIRQSFTSRAKSPRRPQTGLGMTLPWSLQREITNLLSQHIQTKPISITM